MVAMADSSKTDSFSHVVSVNGFAVNLVDASQVVEALETRLKGLSNENLSVLYKVLKNCSYIQQRLDVPQSSLKKEAFDNEHLDAIYKLQLWERMHYADDALRDKLLQEPKMSAHFCLYKHLFHFTHGTVTFLQEDKAVCELAKAAIWSSEILRSLSLYASCLPIYLLPLLLAGYPEREKLSRVAPGIFAFDMLHLFPELFPFCTQHSDTCRSFCLNYGCQLVPRNRLLKLIGGLLTLTDMNLSQISTLFEHTKKLDPTAAGSFHEFELQIRRLFNADGDNWFSLNRERIQPYLSAFEKASSVAASTELLEDQQSQEGQEDEESNLNESWHSSSSSASSYQSVEENSEDDVLEQEDWIIRLARQTFEQQRINSMSFASLVEQVNEVYQEISGQALSSMDILDSLDQSSDFLFDAPHYTVVRYVPA